MKQQIPHLQKQPLRLPLLVYPLRLPLLGTTTSPSTVSTSPVVSYVNNSSFVNAICPSTTIPNSTRLLNSKGTGYLTTITGTGRTIETDHTSDGSGCVSRTTNANSNFTDATCPGGL